MSLSVHVLPRSTHKVHKVHTNKSYFEYFDVEILHLQQYKKSLGIEVSYSFYSTSLLACSFAYSIRGNCGILKL